jgi:hypothetical protein
MFTDLVTVPDGSVSMFPMKRALLILVVCGLMFSVSSSVNAQSEASQQLLQLQEAEVTRLATSTDQLRPLYEDGLIARVEFEKAEKELADAKTKVEETRVAITTAEKLAIEQKKAAELAKVNPLVKRTSMSLSRSSVVTRSTAGSWSLANLSNVQQFFSKTFGKALPISTIGQSATHNRMGWNHRDSVDVGLHPDSAEGRALMAHLQSSGIPFLAFRSAVPGVSTGPHIHIGAPSSRL